MRVIAGEFRHRKLKEVDSKDTRETRDQVKESIFNSVQNNLIDAHVLDLFCGSGSLGIEALSRGAKSALFVDKGALQVNTTTENIITLNAVDRARVLQQDYLAFLNKTDEVFDLIILDPPYHMEVIPDIIRVIQSRSLLSKNGLILCLYGKNVSLDLEEFDIIRYKEKKIGVTKISFLKWGF